MRRVYDPAMPVVTISASAPGFEALQAGQLVSGSFMDYGLRRAHNGRSNSARRCIRCRSHDPLGGDGRGRGHAAAIAAVMNRLIAHAIPNGAAYHMETATPAKKCSAKYWQEANLRCRPSFAGTTAEVHLPPILADTPPILSRG